MSKKCVRKFLRSDATPLMSEAIDEIKSASKNIPNAKRIMCKKHRIGASRYKDIINNRILLEPTNKWRKIINSVHIEPSPRPVTPLPSLKVEQVNEVEQAEQVVNGWQASNEQEEKNISVCSALPLVLSAKGAPSEAGEVKTASEVLTTFSDASNVSSDKIEEDESLILESDIKNLVNRYKKIVGNHVQKTC